MADDVPVLSAEERLQRAEWHVLHPQYGHCRECGVLWTWPCGDARWEATCAALEARAERAEAVVRRLAAFRGAEVESPDSGYRAGSADAFRICADIAQRALDVTVKEAEHAAGC